MERFPGYWKRKRMSCNCNYLSQIISLHPINVFFYTNDKAQRRGDLELNSIYFNEWRRVTHTYVIEDWN